MSISLLTYSKYKKNISVFYCCESLGKAGYTLLCWTLSVAVDSGSVIGDRGLVRICGDDNSLIIRSHPGSFQSHAGSGAWLRVRAFNRQFEHSRAAPNGARRGFGFGALGWLPSRGAALRWPERAQNGVPACFQHARGAWVWHSGCFCYVSNVSLRVGVASVANLHWIGVHIGVSNADKLLIL